MPFTPMMLIVNSVMEQQKEQSEESENELISEGTELSNPDFFEDVLSNPQKYEM